MQPAWCLWPLRPILFCLSESLSETVTPIIILSLNQAFIHLRCEYSTQISHFRVILPYEDKTRCTNWLWNLRYYEWCQSANPIGPYLTAKDCPQVSRKTPWFNLQCLPPGLSLNVLPGQRPGWMLELVKASKSLWSTLSVLEYEFA